jgi:acyl carrier protein
MNCSDAMDTDKNYCVTPGWDSMRFAKELVPGAKYQSYVKMIPTAEDPTVYLGDVYILQDGAIIGKVGGIQFRRYPRILLNRFFSPPDKGAKSSSKSHAASSSTVAVAKEKVQEKMHEKIQVPVVPKQATQPAPSAPAVQEQNSSKEAAPKVEVIPAKAVEAKVAEVTQSDESGGLVDSVLRLIAAEAALELTDLEDDASFAALGVDSLMSLVISEKLRTELDIKVGGSMFMDYPTIGDLKAWLAESGN